MFSHPPRIRGSWRDVPEKRWGGAAVSPAPGACNSRVQTHSAPTLETSKWLSEYWFLHSKKKKSVPK